ncbi:hypothetical protein NYE54_16845 [Paenibacillus sp. FSL K6-1330]|uniref:hypothetical protein n=1 Tax=Paenibacillus sp. FSL K6-1330 TaxID=2975292 RepID=UPI0030DD6665
MKKFLLPFVMTLVLMGLVGCSSAQPNGDDLVPMDKVLEEEQPPKAEIQIGEQMYETKLGTYCWDSKNQSRCVDTIGPVELLKGENPVTVQPGEVITFVMNYEPQPNKHHVNQIYEDISEEVEVKENSFHAPTQKGTYFYSYGVWWMDEHVENLSHGNAFYYFVLKVV